jgi:hypothetical protein
MPIDQGRKGSLFVAGDEMAEQLRVRNLGDLPDLAQQLDGASGHRFRPLSWRQVCNLPPLTCLGLRVEESGHVPD